MSTNTKWILGVAVAIFIGVVAVSSGSSSTAKPDKPKVPDVRGLVLPDATSELKAAGYGVSVKDDSLFGVIVEEHFTVCKQHDPKGHLVPLDVSKDC